MVHKRVEKADGTKEEEYRYYICSIEEEAEKFERAWIHKTLANYTQKTKKYGMMPKVRRCSHAKYFNC